MATGKSSEEDAKTLNASKDSAPEAEASVSANSPKADTSKADASKADAAKGAQIPADTGTIQEARTKLPSSIEHGLTPDEAARIMICVCGSPWL
ncbi:MAG TPA: hypothetical protein VNF45_03165 [Candidatus Binataceae bacterium]|nr:hypothetical protein [Candidatus Binataceae bacterium]